MLRESVHHFIDAYPGLLDIGSRYGGQFIELPKLELESNVLREDFFCVCDTLAMCERFRPGRPEESTQTDNQSLDRETQTDQASMDQSPMDHQPMDVDDSQDPSSRTVPSYSQTRVETSTIGHQITASGIDKTFTSIKKSSVKKAVGPVKVADIPLPTNDKDAVVRPPTNKRSPDSYASAVKKRPSAQVAKELDSRSAVPALVPQLVLEQPKPKAIKAQRSPSNPTIHGWKPKTRDGGYHRDRKAYRLRTPVFIHIDRSTAMPAVMTVTPEGSLVRLSEYLVANRLEITDRRQFGFTISKLLARLNGRTQVT
jgi:hypothetical protein